jgi:PspA/IM30 family
MARFYMTSAALLLALSSTTTTTAAFVPQATKTSRSAFVGSGLVVRSPISSSSSTMLSMNLFDRFSKVAQSNLNSLLQKLEDPEKIMEQAVEDMQVRYST